MSKILIESKSVAYISPWDHLYLVYQDDAGNEYVLRGGPSDPPPVFGNIVVQSGGMLLNAIDSLDKRVDAFGNPLTPADRGSREIDLGGRSAEDVWAILLQQVQNIENAGLPYNLDQNSNSTIASVLNSIGIDVNNTMPYITNGDWPGLGNLLNFDTQLTGTAKDDIIWGYTGNDTLTGDKGNDLLEGGSGNDTYHYTQGDGFDTILDSDSQGNIIYNDVTLTGGSQYGDARVHRDADKHLYVDIGQGLVIDGNIMIKGFQNGNLNLTLTGAVAETNPQTIDPPILGDLAPLDTNPNTDGVQSSNDPLGNLIPDPNQAEANREDFLYDSPGNDAINSGGGNDIIFAFRGGDDLINGGAGQDNVNGGAGNDVIMGGADNDILAGGAGNDRLYADDQISTAGAIANGNSQTGTGLKGEWLAGESGDDTLIGGAGNDVLTGGGGNDLLIGGAGDDDISGDANWVASDFNWTVTITNGVRQYFPVVGDMTPVDAGNDVVYAGKGNDYVWTGDGNDVIFGEDGNDGINGQKGSDIISGGDGNDVIGGQEGDDVLIGGTGDDYLIGNSGNDTLDGGDGADQLQGGAGEDLYLNVTGEDTLTDTEGHSTIQLAQANGIGAGGLTVTNYGDQGQYLRLDIALDNGETLKIQDAFYGTDATFEFANGNQLDLETLVGTSLTTALNLQLDDNGGKLYGGAGADSLYGGSGGDVLSGANGNDNLYANAGNDTLAGGLGADNLFGGADNDTLSGGDGDDFLQGEGGDDSLEGGTGADFLLGGAGNDTYFLDAGSGGDTVIDSEGNNIIRLTGNLATTLTASIANDSANPLLTLGANGVNIAGLGGSLDSYRFEFDDGIQLSLNEFLLNYRTDPLTLQGDDNDNTLSGGLADDALYGNGGDDTLDGGPGNDILDGGAGNDSYLFSTTSGHDVISWQNNDAIGDRIVFAAGIQQADLNISGLANGDLVIAITNQDASLTLTGWFNTALRPSQFQFNDGTVISPEAIAAWRIAPITGTAGDDVLTGSAYDDVIQGNAGNDTLSGGGGNDRLEGDAGRDSYVLKAGNAGLDTVWEQDGESSVIKLEGLDFADLTAKQDGNDLILSWLSHDQGLVLKDYFVQAHQWKVADYSGEERLLADALSDNSAQNAMLNQMDRLEHEFIANWRIEMAGELLADGAVQLTDGRFEQKPVVNFLYTQSTYSPSSAQTNFEYGDLSVSDWRFTSLGIETVTVEEVVELSSQYHNGIRFVSGQDNRYDYSVQEVNLDRHRRVE